ncbi:MAG: non-canonical purine NTP pyrophosphatase [Verrucomicrobia bacterium]|nr:non-canonical purine NTP pyrophosphatase [Verrucomicrobiota bacterium]
MTTLLIATRNAHKVREIRAILGEQLRYLTLNDVPHAPGIVEDAATFSGNAIKKSVALAGWLSARPSQATADPGGAGVFVLADDSGLEVDALGGAPGVMSARFAACEPTGAANSSDRANNAKLLRLLESVPSERRKARFRCVLALTPVQPRRRQNRSPVCYTDELELQTELFEGACEGHLGFEPRGGGGFGYDPLFVPDGFRETFSELGESIKNRISHRARALAKLKERFTAIVRGEASRG